VRLILNRLRSSAKPGFGPHGEQQDEARRQRQQQNAGGHKPNACDRSLPVLIIPAKERVKELADIGNEVLHWRRECFETRPEALLSMR